MITEIMLSFKYLVLTAIAAAFLSREGMVVRVLYSALMLGFKSLAG